MHTTGVFFDLFGTLLIYGDMKAAWRDWLATFYRCLTRYGLALSPEAFARQCDRFMEQEEPAAWVQGLTVFERRIHTLCMGLDLSVPPEALSDIANTIIRAWQDHITLDTECYAVLQALNSHKTLALISNFDHPPHVYRLLSELGLEAFFETVIVSGDVGVKKPDPQIFQGALDRTGLQPEQVVYVGDTDEDVQGAHAAAIRPILIRREAAEEEPPCLDFQVDSTLQPAPSLRSIQAAAGTITRLSDLIKLLG